MIKLGLRFVFITGVVTSVGDRFMVVSVEEFDEEWCDTKVLIALVPDDMPWPQHLPPSDAGSRPNVSAHEASAGSGVGSWFQSEGVRGLPGPTDRGDGVR